MGFIEFDSRQLQEHFDLLSTSWSNPLPLLQGIDDFTSDERGILDFVHQYTPNENSTPTPHQPAVNFPSGNIQVRYK